jgi:hypothetical protein
LKRAETDTFFESNQGAVIVAALKKSMETGERVNDIVNVIAKNTKGEIVATFEMGISLKVL